MILIDGDDLFTVFPVDDDEPNLSHIRTVNRMAEYIRKDTARRIIDSHRNKEQMLAMLDAVPSEDVQTLRHGRWNCGDDIFEYAVCSCCKWDSGEAWEYAKKYFKFCPNCGAQMDEPA